MARHRPPPPPPLSNEHQDDVAELLASSGGFEASLTLAEKIIIDRATTAQIFSEKCAAEISLVWTTIQQRGKDHPQALRSFRDRVEERIRGITGHSLEDWIALGFQTMQKFERCAQTIRQHWGCEPMQVLPPEKYSGERPLSPQILKGLADLSTIVSAGEGRQILLAEIEKRAQPGREVKTRSYQAFLTLSAVKEAVTVAKSQRSNGNTGVKRKRVEPPDAAYTPQHTPQSTPRQKKATVKQPAFAPRPRQAPAATPKGPAGPHDTFDTVDDLGSGGDGSSIRGKIGQHTEPLDADLSTILEDASTVLEVKASDISAEIGQHAEQSQADLSTAPEEESVGYDDSGPVVQGDALLSQSSPLQLRSMTIDQPCQPSPGSRMRSSPMASVPSSLRKVQGDGNPRNREARASPEPLSGTAAKEQMAESEDGLTQAIATLESGQRLSSTVIYEVLDACAPSDCHVVDPLFVDPKFRSTQRRRVKSLRDGVSTVFIPLHDPEHQHWTLAVLRRREDSTAHHFDSCRSLDTIIDIKALNGCMEQLDEQYESKDIILAECPQQDNDFDCGVEVIANALCQMTGIPALPIRNCDVWRPICKALISQKVAQAAAGSDLGYDLASLLCDETLGAEDERRHQLARDILKKLQSKREQVNWEKCEAVHIEIVLAQLIQSNGQTITSLGSELEAVKVSAEALSKDFEASNQQYSQLIPKYFIPDHRPALRKTLEAVEAIESRLQRRLQRLQTSTTKLNIARMTLESFREMYVTTLVQLDEDQESMEEAVRAWRDEATARAERARHTLALFKEAR